VEAGFTLNSGEKITYNRTVTIGQDLLLGCTLLHFGAVDSECKVYWNGVLVGAHTGGFTAFTVNISDVIKEGENTLTVVCTDEGTRNGSARGKQSDKRGGIWYTPQSGIWQTVWLESMPKKNIGNFRITPDAKEKTVAITLDNGSEAEITVFDGEKEIYLTGKTNKDYFPPYIYTTSMMSGEVGKTYSLKVVYGGKTAEAETVIPKPAELEYIHAQEAEGDDYVLLAGFRDNPDTKDYYKFFAKVSSKDSVFKSSFLGLVDDDILTDEVNEVQVMNGYNPSSLSQDPNVYFQRGDRVLVRFSTLGESEYNYWKDFDDVSYLSLNPFFPVTKKIRSNVRGGSGYWAGYGSSHYVVTIPD
jgi:hypothetical protein